MTAPPQRTKTIFDAAPYPFHLGAARLEARPTGALWWRDRRALCVADLHLGKAESTARSGGPLLPPYETTETLTRLSDEIDRLNPDLVICLGDSFDDARAPLSLTEEHHGCLNRMMAGRRWIWIAGNHDPAPLELVGDHLHELRLDGLTFRHIAAHSSTGCSLPQSPSAAPQNHRIGSPRHKPVGTTIENEGEISGHYHPKATLVAQGRRLSRRCFLTDGRRAILPAFGAYTGGLDASDEVFDPLMGPEAAALLLGRTVRAIPRAALLPSGGTRE
ncbi:MAG: metallophosphoesterase [Rhodobacteraceae bacterium]|nr:metallophosphoesterase [Paracoccaceae bacterium]